MGKKVFSSASIGDFLERDKAIGPSSDEKVAKFMQGICPETENRVTIQSAEPLSPEQRSEAEGVIRFPAAWRPTQNRAVQPSNDLSEDELHKLGAVAPVRPVFEGALDRQSMANALRSLRADAGLSIRQAAEIAGTGKNDISRIEAGEATLDKAAMVLERLGYKLTFAAAPENTP